MQTFQQILNPSAYTEILNGGSAVAFDCISESAVTFIFSMSASVPGVAEASNAVHTWPSGWDFEASGLAPGAQRIWVKGVNTIVGVRG